MTRSVFVNGCCSFESKNILHVVEASRFVFDPGCCVDCAGGEGHAGRGFVGEFNAFAVGGKHDGVIANDIATTKRVHADFFGFAWADVAVTAVSDVVLVGCASFLVEDFEECASGAGGSIDFVFVVHFRHFDVEAVLFQDAGGLAGEPEKGVHADRVVRGEDDGELGCGFLNEGAFFISVAGGSDDQRGIGFQRRCHDVFGERVDREIDRAIGSGKCRIEVFTGVVGRSSFRVWVFIGCLEERLAHASRFACDE